MRAHDLIRWSSAALAASLLFTLARADDANPSPFRFMNPTSTVQEWDYSTASLPLVADGSMWGTGGAGFVNPFGVPRHTIRAGAAGWLASHAGGGGGPRTGIVALPVANSRILHEVPNVDDPFGRKAFWIQVTWVSSQAAPPLDVIVETGAGQFHAAPGAQFLLPDGWRHTTYVLAVEPCPPQELVIVGNSQSGIQYFVDQLVVDTICEPDFRRLVPTHVTFQFGRVDSGNLASLLSDDGNVLRVCRFITPNAIVPPVQFEVESRATGMGTLDALRLDVKSRMFTAGSFSQTLELFDYALGQYRDFNLEPAFNTVFATRTVQATQPVASYMNAARDVKARVSVRKTGPSAAVAWCAEFESWGWLASD